VSVAFVSEGVTANERLSKLKQYDLAPMLGKVANDRQISHQP
jgi:hypothetical protein